MSGKDERPIRDFAICKCGGMKYWYIRNDSVLNGVCFLTDHGIKQYGGIWEIRKIYSFRVTLDMLKQRVLFEPMTCDNCKHEATKEEIDQNIHMIGLILKKY